MPSINHDGGWSAKCSACGQELYMKSYDYGKLPLSSDFKQHDLEDCIAFLTDEIRRLKDKIEEMGCLQHDEI